MKICHINASDIGGGAARAAYRLHVGLRYCGQASSMYVMYKQSSDPDIMKFQPSHRFVPRLKHRLRRERITHRFTRYRTSRPPGLEMFSDDRTQFQGEVMDQLPDCDVFNLHWIAGFIDYMAIVPALAKKAPVVWTLHDMNPLTGGCHYSGECRQYINQCGSCPQLGSYHTRDLSHQIWQRKQWVFSHIQTAQFHIVTPSRWLADQVKRSSVLQSVAVSVIPYGLDTDVFVPQDKCASRQILGIPQDAKIILFVADSITNRRKGFVLLQEALTSIEHDVGLFLLSLGNNKPNVVSDIPQLHIGTIANDRLLSAIYSAADLFVIPSLEDNLPNTVLEAMACAVPVIGFDVGGIPDMVRPGVTGALVPVGDVQALRDTIIALLSDSAKRATIASNCRQIAVEEYALAIQAGRYIQLYESMIERGRG